MTSFLEQGKVQVEIQLSTLSCRTASTGKNMIDPSSSWCPSKSLFTFSVLFADSNMAAEEATCTSSDVQVVRGRLVVWDAVEEM